MIPRVGFAAVVLASSALAAGPALTTIQDILYKADGTRFNGSVTISWNSFQSLENTSILTQSTTVKIVDGILRVQLAPTTSTSPPISYKAVYTSDGKVQFQETWSVPASSHPLRVREVRSSSGTTPPAGETGSEPIPESQVIGLIADLGARPLKGPGFAPGAVAIIDSSGLLGAATGDPSDCVRVDGSSGPCGGANLSFVDNESLTGIVDGSNTTFALATAPQPVSSLALHRNGILQKAGEDFTLTGTTVQFVTAATPQSGDILLASYRTAGAATEPIVYAAPQVLCSGSGAVTTSTTLAIIGNCSISSGILLPGDRVEIRFDLTHTSTSSGFTFEARWGNTVLVHRDAQALDLIVAGRSDASLLLNQANLSTQSWGSVLPLSATVATASDDYASGLTISFLGMVAQSNDSLKLATFSVVRIP